MTQPTKKLMREADRCGVARVEVTEGLLEHQDREHLGGAGWATLGQDPDVIKRQERPDRRHQDHEDDRRPDTRQRHIAELLPAVRAVQPGALVEVRRNVLHAGQKEHHQEAPPVPVINEAQWSADAVFGSPRKALSNPGTPISVKKRGNTTVRAEQAAPERGRDDARQHVRDEERQAKDDRATPDRRQQAGGDQRHGDGDGQEHRQPEHIVHERVMEARVPEQGLVVRQADPLRRADTAPLRHGEVDRAERWRCDNENIDQQDWQHKEPGHDLAPVERPPLVSLLRRKDTLGERQGLLHGASRIRVAERGSGLSLTRLRPIAPESAAPRLPSAPRQTSPGDPPGIPLAVISPAQTRSISSIRYVSLAGGQKVQVV